MIPLRIGGFEKLSAVDWPGHLAAVVFCQGCAWRCGYCHNPHLMPFAVQREAIAWRDVEEFMGRRHGLLDGVVFSGGEPTLQPGLCGAIAAVREMGFLAALHTGGPDPGRMREALPLVDWVGFDFKAPFDRYRGVTGRDDGGRARESFELLCGSGVACEVRTTWHPALLSTDDLVSMAETLTEAGRTEWVIQRFRVDGCDSPALVSQPIGEPPIEMLQNRGLRVTCR